MEGTIALVLVRAPTRCTGSEDMPMFPGGISVERIQALSRRDVVDRHAEPRRHGRRDAGHDARRPPAAPSADPAEREKRRTTMFKAEMQRWMFALLGAPAGEVTYAGVAESPDGKADMIEMKDARGQALRLFVDQRRICR